MSIHRDLLDDEIDQVATRLTHVDEDAQFATRIIAALPERSTWFGWLTHSWAPRLAMMAIIAGSIAFWSSRHTTDVSPAASPLASVANTNWPKLAASAREREPVLEPDRTRPLEPWDSGTLEPAVPFEGLPSIAAPKALAMSDVTPEALPAEGALSVPSIVIADLPLTAESFPERDY
jgi:hypothetical protein